MNSIHLIKDARNIYTSQINCISRRFNYLYLLVIFGLNLCHTIMRYALRKTYVLLITINMVLEKFLYTSIFKSHIDKNTFNGKCIVMTLHLGQK